MESKIKTLIHKGGLHEDQRGSIGFFNSFNLQGFHRFYIIEPASTNTIRAWQAHKYENKAFVVVQGSFELVWVKIDDFDNPNEGLVAESITLKEDEPQIKIVPGGFANGFRAVSENSKILVFSDRSLDSSLDDDYRYDPKLWHSWD